ncbi:small-conductance mechanosensitive channel [Bacillus sp. OxB-1]|uniref:mechanosensitive ion channel family protein n=1 Tax=Bacillus sp. (strain OxB-1) TaxID=98228 RepID=UPI00058225EC|nr:mechanosensitive ion channel family protein [Bacillus sp. OxB-1]BAQ09430.1 small-conductance mechanosensitive channel [Bacillus sp. OxB-1]
MASPAIDIPEKVEQASKFLFSQETWEEIGKTSLEIFIIVLLAVLAVRLGKAFINRIFKLKWKGPLRHSERREITLLRLLENTLSYIIYFSAILAILSEFMDVRGLLAGAGVLGLAVGFGAQSLVKDVITGFFILFEDQFSVGDYVKIGSAEGTVEEIGLRTTKVKSPTGEVSIIPNGGITQVVNYSLENSLAIVDVHIPFEVGIEKTESLMESYLANLPSGHEEFIKAPKLIGAQEFTDTDMTVRIIAETQPMKHYDCARLIAVGLKKYLDLEGIQIPYPTIITKSFTSS